MKIDLTISASNPVYAGLQINEVGGRTNLVAAMEAATLNIVGRNVARMVADEADRDTCVLTGPSAVQIYCIVFHAVVHAFSRVCYLDGKGQLITISQHG